MELRWLLTGKDAVQNNITNIQILDRQYPGIEKFISSPADYVRIVPQEIKTYPDGVPISSNLPNAYGIPPVENKMCKNCKFRYNNYCSRWIAQIRRQYWCASYKRSEKPNSENTLY